MLSPALTDFLRVHRTDCNARFAAARRRWPRLDAEDFALFLRDQLSPLATALDAAVPVETHRVLVHAYSLGYQLIAEKLAGPSAPNTSINRIWNGLFPCMPELIAENPRLVLTALGNAAHQLGNTPGTKPDLWRARLVDFIPKCPNAEVLLVMAQVLAWRAGLSHYRTSALLAANHLPPRLALEALEAPAGADWDATRDAHLRDPWFGYGLDPDSREHRIGSFRGFGGLFLTPPLVTSNGSQLLVLSGGDAWILVADAFGATFHRAAPEEVEAAAHPPRNSVDLDGTSVRTSPRSHALRVGPASPRR